MATGVKMLQIGGGSAPSHLKSLTVARHSLSGEFRARAWAQPWVWAPLQSTEVQHAEGSGSFISNDQFHLLTIIFTYIICETFHPLLLLLGPNSVVWLSKTLGCWVRKALNHMPKSRWHRGPELGPLWRATGVVTEVALSDGFFSAGGNPVYFRLGGKFHS